MRIALLYLTFPGWLFAQDAREIVSRSVERDQGNFERAKDYTCIERVERREINADGRVKSVESKTFDMTIIEGEPYSRQIEKNDKALWPDESRKAQEKFDKTLRERREESPEKRQKRLAKAEKERREGREFLRELPSAFDFTLAGEEQVDGHDVWVIEAEPRPDYKPKVPRAGSLKNFRGKIWIEKAGYQWVRVEAEAIDTLSFGWLLARVSKGTRIEFRQTRINHEVWLPSDIHLRLDARLALLKRIRQDVDVTYRNYRKFQTDSRIVSTEELH